MATGYRPEISDLDSDQKNEPRVTTTKNGHVSSKSLNPQQKSETKPGVDSASRENARKDTKAMRITLNSRNRPSLVTKSYLLDGRPSLVEKTSLTS